MSVLFINGSANPNDNSTVLAANPIGQPGQVGHRKEAVQVTTKRMSASRQSS